jgi:TolB-like protein
MFIKPQEFKVLNRAGGTAYNGKEGEWRRESNQETIRFVP